MMKNICLLAMLLMVVVQAFSQNEVRLPQKPKQYRYTDHTERGSGFWCAVEMNAGSSLVFSHANFQRVGLSYSGGYMVSEYLKCGLGLGASYYVNNNSHARDTKIGFTMPIFFDIRGNMVSQQVRSFVPYWSFDIGGAVRDGFFMSPTIGMRFGQKRDSWLLGLSYMLNRISNAPHYPKTVSVFALKAGYEF